MDIVARPLVSRRLVLEPLREDHAALLYEGISDPRVWRFIDQEPPTSLRALRDRYARLAAGCPRDGEAWLNWVACLPGESAVGIVELTISRARRVADLAYLFVPSSWRRGLATEACTCVLDELHTQRWVDVVRATIDARNTASVALARKLGLEPVGDSRAGTDAERRFERRIPRQPASPPAEAPAGIRLRTPTTYDTEALRALRRFAGWDEEHVERWIGQTREPTKVLWLAETADADTVAMVALDLVDDDREVADGVAIAAVSGLVVAPAFARRGLGRWLTSIAEDEARLRGFGAITLNTRPTNEGALALYQSMGYVRFKDQERSWGLAAHLRKTLR